MSERGGMVHIAGVLAERYLSLTLADFGATFALLLQAPLVGLCIAAAWGEDIGNPGSLNFTLAFSSVLFGCVNAFREVVKERAIFLREKRIGVPVRSYILSKVLVLALIAFVQCVILTLFVHSQVPGYKLSRLSLMTYLLTGALAGTALGLLVSSAVRTQQAAVAWLPVVLVPQLIFNEVVLGSTKNRPEQLENILPVAWVYTGLSELWDSSWDGFIVVKSLLAPALLTLIFLALATALLSLARED